MPRFNFYSQSRKVDLGTYEADNSKAAHDLMAKKAGYRNAAHMIKVAGEDPSLMVTETGLHASPEPAAITERREAAGLTQAQSAAMVGVTVRTWAYWEAGKFKMDPELWQRFVERTARLIK